MNEEQYRYILQQLINEYGASNINSLSNYQIERAAYDILGGVNDGKSGQFLTLFRLTDSPYKYVNYQLGIPPTTTTTAPTAPTTTTSTIPTTTTSTAPSPYTGLPTFTTSTSTTGYQAPIIPMGGATEDQINYLSNLRRLATQDQMARVQSQQQRSEIATQYEPQIRKAGRDIYNQGVKAQASLGARGISGAPGISVAARRAAMAAPAAQRTSLLNERNRQLAALERTLATQLSSYEEEIRRNQEQLTRATTLANQLTGTGK